MLRVSLAGAVALDPDEPLIDLEFPPQPVRGLKSLKDGLLVGGVEVRHVIRAVPARDGVCVASSGPDAVADVERQGHEMPPGWLIAALGGQVAKKER